MAGRWFDISPDAERSIGLVVPDGLDANTLSGLCMDALGEMPEVGKHVEKYGFRFTVESMDNHRVGNLLIEKLDAYEPTDEST